MLYRRENYPAEDEFVLCTVTKVLNHAIFVNLDEYDKGGLIHISEVAPGRIRNIREYVELGKKVVCKVLRTDAERGHIDLSLRRVSEMEKKKKLEDIKQEQKAEKIVEMISKQLDLKQVYESVTEKVFDRYSFLHLFFQDVAAGTVNPSDFISDSRIADAVKEHAVERFKAAKVALKGLLTIKSYAPNGVEILRDTLGSLEDKWNAHLQLGYLGGGRYRLRVEADSYKGAEQILKEVCDSVTERFTAHDGEANFLREES